MSPSFRGGVWHTGGQYMLFTYRIPLRYRGQDMLSHAASHSDTAVSICCRMPRPTPIPRSVNAVACRARHIPNPANGADLHAARCRLVSPTTSRTKSRTQATPEGTQEAGSTNRDDEGGQRPSALRRQPRTLPSSSTGHGADTSAASTQTLPRDSKLEVRTATLQKHGRLCHPRSVVAFGAQAVSTCRSHTASLSDTAVRT
jgi:hypothetical protein